MSESGYTFPYRGFRRHVINLAGSGDMLIISRDPELAGSGDMLLISRDPETCHQSRGCLGVLRGLGSVLRGAEVSAEAGHQPFDEGFVAEGRAFALLDDVMRDAGSDDPCQSCHRRRVTGLPGESEISKVSRKPPKPARLSEISKVFPKPRPSQR